MKRINLQRAVALYTGICAAAFFAAAIQLSAEPGSRNDTDRIREPETDKGSRAVERADRDAARASERAVRDQSRFTEERNRIVSETAGDPVRQQQELAKLEEDRTEDLAKAQEEAEKSAERLSEELAKEAEDAADDELDRADDSARYGSSGDMRDLAVAENPDYDGRGFPVRSGEIAGLDLTPPMLASLQAQGFAVVARHPLDAFGSVVYRLGTPRGLDVAAALELARASSPDATFDFTHYYGPQFAPSGMRTTGAPAELPRRKGKLTIGMIDTAVANHTALRGVSIARRSFGSTSSGAPSAHGTAVASILASEGSSRIFAASVFRGSAARPFTSADAIVDALNWMVENQVPVVNMSLSGPRNAILDRLVAQAVGRGTLIVAAAGNGGPSAPPAYPAALRPVVAVTAVDANKRVYRYANQGPYITVAAYGVAQPAADVGGGIGRFDGTSFATPHVAAWMARCLGQSDAAACGRSLRKSAIDLGEPGYDPVYGHGLIDR